MIGFRGLAGAGKTTLARYLCSILRDSAVLPFAGPLKQAIEEVLGFHKDTHPDLYRVCCQALGQGARTVDPRIWVQKWKDGITERNYHRGEDIRFILVDDVRYLNEAGCCDLLFYIARHDNPTPTMNHESENWNAAGYDATIDVECLENSGDHAGLVAMAARVIEHILVRGEPRCRTLTD